MNLSSPQPTRNRLTRAAGLFVSLFLFCFAFLPGAASAQTGGGELPGPTPEETFREEILPVFKEHCLRCHGEELMVKELDLSRLSSLLKGSESGPVVVPGRAAESKLYRLIESGSMPPDREGGLPEAQKAAIRAWIETGLASGQEEAAASRSPESARRDSGPAAPLHHLSRSAPSG